MVASGVQPVQYLKSRAVRRLGWRAARRDRLCARQRIADRAGGSSGSRERAHRAGHRQGRPEMVVSFPAESWNPGRFRDKCALGAGGHGHSAAATAIAQLNFAGRPRFGRGRGGAREGLGLEVRARCENEMEADWVCA